MSSCYLAETVTDVTTTMIRCTWRHQLAGSKCNFCKETVFLNKSYINDRTFWSRPNDTGLSDTKCIGVNDPEGPEKI